MRPARTKKLTTEAFRLAPLRFRELRSNLAEGLLKQMILVGPARFELAASSSRTRRSTKLSHGPTTEVGEALDKLSILSVFRMGKDAEQGDKADGQDQGGGSNAVRR